MAVERILVVDDEPGVRAALEAILVDEGFDVAAVETGEECLRALDGDRYDAVLLDVWLPGIDGLETLRRLRERNQDVEVVMISGHGTIDTAVRATKFGAFDFVEKPLSLDRTLLVLRNALRQRRLERRNRQLLAQLARDTEIVGSSPAAESLRAVMEVAAQTDTPVLICGDPGSGRETVARRIHSTGRRPSAPFVELPGAALDAGAAEHALYTEARDGGRLALASGGTLFLQDVDRLDLELQRRLAATLEARRRERGDLRVVASARRDPRHIEDALKQFLDVIRIAVPSLRERREDVELLAERCMTDLAREYGRPPKKLGADALAALRAYNWPGNIRELWNVIERLLLLVEGETVHARDLPETLGGSRGPGEDLYREFRSLEQGLRTFTRYYIRRVLVEESGNRRSAARRLGLDEEALARRLAELGGEDEEPA